MYQELYILLRSATHPGIGLSYIKFTIRISKITLSMGKKNQTLLYSAWRKQVEKTYAKTRLLKVLIASQPIFHLYITDILGEELFILHYISY